jgi:hypothetical protein
MKFGVKEVMDVTFYDTVTGKPVLYMDTLTISSLSSKADQASAVGGKGNSKLISWDFNRTTEMEVEDALLSTKSLELLTGNAVKKGAQKIYMRQSTVWETVDSVMTNKGGLYPLVATAGGAITLAFTPNESAANILVYEVSDDGGTPLAAGTLSGTTLTNVAWANKKLVVYYSYQSSASTETYVISADKFAGTYRVVGDTIIRNAETQKDEAFQVQINNYKLKSDLNLDMKASGDPSPFKFSGEILREATNTNMVTLIKY